MSAPSATLGGSWTHSIEEDEGEVRVYRSTHTFPFPPSRRGRDTFESGPEGEVATGLPGPDDRVQLARTRLTALGMNRYRLAGTAGAPDRVIVVVEATLAVLKLRFV